MLAICKTVGMRANALHVHLYTSYKFLSRLRVSESEKEREKREKREKNKKENNFPLLNNWPPDFKVGSLGSSLDV